LDGGCHLFAAHSVQDDVDAVGRRVGELRAERGGCSQGDGVVTEFPFQPPGLVR